MENSPRNKPPYFLAARRFFGYALRRDATALYTEIGSPTPMYLARQTTRHLIAAGLTDQFFSTDDVRESQERTLFLKGIEDTRRIVETTLDHHRPSDQSDALAIVRHPNTILSVAKLALREENALDSLIALHEYRPDRYDYYYRTAEDLTHIEHHRSLVVSEFVGCPMAGHEGEVAPDPLFNRFVPWAGELAVRSLYLHKYKKDR